MRSTKPTLLLALCLLLVALAAGKEPRSNPNNHMRKKTKPPSSHDPYANMPDTSRKSKTKPPSAQKPIKTPKPKPTKPENYDKCTTKYCDKTLLKIETIVDETMQRCNATSCSRVAIWARALADSTVALDNYTPKLDKKDSEPCWAEYCRKQTNNLQNPAWLAYAQTNCNAALCPKLFNLTRTVRSLGGTVPAPR